MDKTSVSEGRATYHRAPALPPKKRCWITMELEPESQIVPEPEHSEIIQNVTNDEVSCYDITEIKGSDAEVPEKTNISNDEEVGKVTEETEQISKDETEVAFMLTAMASLTPSKDDELSKPGESNETTNVNSNKMMMRKPRKRNAIATITNPSKSVVRKPRSNTVRKPRRDFSLIKFNVGFKEKEENLQISNTRNDLYSAVKTRSRRNNAGAAARRSMLAEEANGANGAEGRRCIRRNGKGWRCRSMAASGRSLCDHHLFQGTKAKTNAQKRRVVHRKRPRRFMSLVDIYKRTKEVELSGGFY